MDNLFVTITDNEPLSIGLSITEDPIELKVIGVSDETISIQLNIIEEPVDILMSITEEPFKVAFATIVEVGPAGASAYQIAVANGFDGTEEEWLESLVANAPLKWIDYVVGYSEEPELTTSPLSGELYAYTYQDTTILYRFIASDNSQDAFYSTYQNNTLSGLVATKRM